MDFTRGYNHIVVRLTLFEADAVLHALQQGRPLTHAERQTIRTFYQSLMAHRGAPSAAETQRIEAP